MTTPVTATSYATLRQLTGARVALGRAGASLPTQAQLAFTLDHARARDAVHAPFDAESLASGLASLGLDAVQVSSRAQDRRTYLTRPDLGRQLDDASRATLEQCAQRACDLAIVVGDGLSPQAVALHAVPVIHGLMPGLREAGLGVGVTAVASGARVALGDEVGQISGARLALVLIGERPGLSAPHSLGAYITYAPRMGITDAARNCISNIHAAGLGHDEAAGRIGWLVRTALARCVSGVALKDDSGAAMLPGVAHTPRSPI